MFKTKSFVRKTNRGNIVKVIKEHYLRDDIGCGFSSCSVCEQLSPNLLDPTNFPPNSNHTTHKNPHYIIPDTNILYHQIDLIEHPAIRDLIILQTVLEELRHRSLHVYQRIRRLISDPQRRFYVFCNEHHQDTFIEKHKNESPNDRNDRAIRTATSWYQRHLLSAFGNLQLDIVLLTDDAENRKKAKCENIYSYSISDYISGVKRFPDLIDMLALSDDTSALDKKFVYPEHYSTLKTSTGLKMNSLFQGSLNISFHNYLEGSIFANIDGQEQTILIIGRLNLNRAIHGDIVAIELLPCEEWALSQKEGIVLDEDEENENENRLQSTQLEDKMQLDSTPFKPIGKVVSIIKRNIRPYCGSIDSSSLSSNSTTQSLWFWAMDKRIPKIRIKSRQAANLIGKRIIVAIDSWPINSRNPLGHFVKTLGEVGEKSTETQAVLLEHDVPFLPFVPQVLACLPPQGDKWVVDDDPNLKNREDLRHLDVCSIDPPGCTDIDDALHALQLPNGNYQVGVHIADVSHFVKSNNAMDEEAARRGTSVYLVDKRIDMLPGLLGTNLCSLHSNADKLAFSCIWEITPLGDVIDAVYKKSIIRSRNSFTYDEAQARLDDPKMTDSVSKSIKILDMLAKKLRAKRMIRGALVLASPEVRFKLENDSQDPVDVEMKELKDTNALVEEFMLLANIYVAKKIQIHFPDSSMLRRHPKPPAANFENLKQSALLMGIELKFGNSKELADSLDKAIIPDDPYFNKLLRVMTTRCMMQAVYFCGGTQPESEFWHYGLATEIYTHFTSPIRRYADLIVHRLLAACIGYDKEYSSDLMDKSKMTELSEVLNYRHRMAQQASRSSVEIFTNTFFKGKQVIEEGRILKILKNGFVVLIPKYGVEGIVHSSLPDGKSLLNYDAKKERLYCPTPNGMVTLAQFSKIKVKISVEETSKQAQRSKLALKLIEPVIPGL